MAVIRLFRNGKCFSVWIGITGGHGSKPIRTAAEITARTKYFLPASPIYIRNYPGKQPNCAC